MCLFAVVILLQLQPNESHKTERIPPSNSTARNALETSETFKLGTGPKKGQNFNTQPEGW